MTSNYKSLVAIDVDGTLLDSENRISKGAAEAISNLKAEGILTVLASGRSLDGVTPYYQELDLAPYLIGAGGGIISTTAGDVIEAFELPHEITHKIIEIARDIGVGIACHQVDCLRFESTDEQIKIINRNLPGELSRYSNLLEVISQSPVVKFTLWDDHHLLINAQNIIRSFNVQVDMMFSGEVFLEITNPGVSKGKALKLLASHLSIPHTRIAAIGDHYNDVSMFEVAPVSIAMGNAPDDVKALANYIAPVNDEGGLAWALENVVGKLWDDQN